MSESAEKCHDNKDNNNMKIHSRFVHVIVDDSSFNLQSFLRMSATLLESARACVMLADNCVALIKSVDAAFVFFFKRVS